MQFDPQEFGQMTVSKILPTVFAKSICKSVGLMDPEEYGIPFVEELFRLQQFQQMSIVCSFEEALISFYGAELTEDQKIGLKLIYKTTQPWMKGHAIGVLLERMNSKTTRNKDFAESMMIILDQLSEESDSDGTPATGKRTKELIVKLAGTISQVGDKDEKNESEEEN